jgi:3-oxoacyl-[acyl-carrier protein] reductase
MSMTTQTRSLTGKGALVTGGSKGIGAAIVRRLAVDGASVALTFLHPGQAAFQLAHEIESSGDKGLVLKADSASANELRAAVADARESLVRRDIFVSNVNRLVYPAPFVTTARHRNVKLGPKAGRPSSGSF